MMIKIYIRAYSTNHTEQIGFDQIHACTFTLVAPFVVNHT